MFSLCYNYKENNFYKEDDRRLKMKKFPFYKNQVLPDVFNKPEHNYNNLDELLKWLEDAKRTNKTIKVYSDTVDSSTGLVELSFGEEYDKKVRGYVERNDVTYHLDNTGEVHIGRCIDCLDNYIGVKVKEINYDSTNDYYKVKCSRKDAVKEVHDKYNSDIEKGILTANMMVKGHVTGMDYNKVYVDIGGDVTAILGVADISKAYVADPADVFNIGDKVELVIKKIYANPIKTSLSRAMLLPGWESIDEKYKVGKIVPGIVKNRIATGIFVELDESFEGLADFPANDQKYEFGDRVKVRINVIDKKREKIKLKIIGNR